ncbi:hypothetical protein FACS189440_19360 [Bacteroidia bacterium]|nr:hypothetical protein FACS189423_07140 [Bacteroidia bacterium]GHT50988.1 hypothetical protein FACS189440_19360 [Bacteroidia bacterium]
MPIAIERPKKYRKLIDLDESTKTALSFQAIEYGVTLKKYIEVLLARDAEMQEDKHFAQIMIDDMNSADTNDYLTGKELENFEKDLDKYR